ncbi:hypothetical protein C6T65_30900 [Burkholderia vietnamiensis]|uniref:Uncharacterized protein n=1 Tax=Burkholderia vietnamiensis TaxID=60552 RepID=A0AA44XZI0_BURVI|nr:hypothetical protein WK28_09560 [Burkholderia vietnamiensis]PRH38539.1 hypothetical protein C6T65_30900 [Burkholderia vietnamiensis]
MFIHQQRRGRVEYLDRIACEEPCQFVVLVVDSRTVDELGKSIVRVRQHVDSPLLADIIFDGVGEVSWMPLTVGLVIYILLFWRWVRYIGQERIHWKGSRGDVCIERAQEVEFLCILVASSQKLPRPDRWVKQIGARILTFVAPVGTGNE